MKFLNPQAAPALVPVTIRGALSAIKTGIGKRVSHAVAKFANYNAASPTATTRVGGRIGTNPQSTFSSIQRVGMQWTAEDIEKNCPLGTAYLGQRQNYCSSVMRYIPDTGDEALDADLTEYLHGDDGFGGVFGQMGVDCSMQDAFLRTADLEMPIRGDAGLIWYDDGAQLRLMEFSADQLGEIYYFVPPRSCSLARDAFGNIIEVSGRDCTYFAGRYFKGCDCVAYKIYERTDSWYGSPKIYQAADVIYFRDPASFRGVRGVTVFHAAIQHMEKGEALFQIGMDAALRQAKTAMIVYNNRGQPDEPTYATNVPQDGRTVYSERIPGGPLTEYFFTGDSAQFASPDSPGPELIQGVETSDERVALALRVNYAWLISATKVGGAPSRLEVNKASKEMSRIQTTIHRPRLRRISQTTIMDAVRRGYFPATPRITRGSWMLPISATVDAGYSNDENITNLRAGLESPQDLVAETNRDFKTVVRKKQQAAIMVARAVEDGNRALTSDGYKPTITALDIAQLSDNPQQAAAAENLAEGKTATGVSSTPAAKAA